MKIRYHLKRHEAQDLAGMLRMILEKTKDTKDDIIVDFETITGEYMNGTLNFWTYKETK